MIHVKNKEDVTGAGENDNDLFGGWLEEQKRKHQFQVVGPQADIANFVNQQIIFIEPSPVQKKLQELRAQGQTFQDSIFPPNDKSLTGEWGTIS